MIGHQQPERTARITDGGSFTLPPPARREHDRYQRHWFGLMTAWPVSRSSPINRRRQAATVRYPSSRTSQQDNTSKRCFSSKSWLQVAPPIATTLPASVIIVNMGRNTYQRRRFAIDRRRRPLSRTWVTQKPDFRLLPRHQYDIFSASHHDASSSPAATVVRPQSVDDHLFCIFPFSVSSKVGLQRSVSVVTQHQHAPPHVDWCPPTFRAVSGSYSR